MDGKYYAVSNLKVIAENINAYASYARNEVNDPYSEIFDEIERAQKAVKRLANWIQKH